MSSSKEGGEAAAKELANEGVKAKIDVLQLDVTDDAQILEAIKYVAINYQKLDVLINNTGVIQIIPDFSLPTLRKTINSMLDINLTSVAVVTSGFSQLLQKSEKPKVINITSGLGSIKNTLDNTKPIAKYPPYRFSKVGLNGVTAHMQVFENDRWNKDKGEGKTSGHIQFYSVAPGLLKTAFTNFNAAGRDPKDGAEAVVRLIEGDYPGGTQWEFVDGSMKEVPW
ncbi:hypothetical protein B7463_g10035, partial [Scytalidium lignicola]